MIGPINRVEMSAEEELARSMRSNIDANRLAAAFKCDLLDRGAGQYRKFPRQGLPHAIEPSGVFASGIDIRPRDKEIAQHGCGHGGSRIKVRGHELKTVSSGFPSGGSDDFTSDISHHASYIIHSVSGCCRGRSLAAPFKRVAILRHSSIQVTEHLRCTRAQQGHPATHR
jgi:hypothetical protein